MMRRLPSTLAGAPLVAAVGARTFSSNYGSNVGKVKPSHKFNSRSAAHRHPARQTTWKSKDAPAPAVDAVRETEDDNVVATHADTADTTAVEAEPPASVIPRRVKSRYQSYFEPRSEPMTFTSTFSSSATAADTNATYGTYAARTQDTTIDANAEKLEDAVTKIYSAEEVGQMGEQVPSRTRGKTSARQRQQSQRTMSDELEGTDSAQDGAADLTLNDNDNVDDGADEETDTASDTFEAVRHHPYFNDLVRRTDANISRYRKELRATGRYSRGAVDDCIRPLLQLVDYPFTARTLPELVNNISPVALRNSLKEMHHCRKLHIYHSKDTDVLLDWTVEDFLRRRYESIHISWEPLDVVRKRFGWSQDVLTDRDCLLYLSEFTDLIEIGELRMSAKGSLKAVSIKDPVALVQSGADLPRGSRLLVRRAAQADTEPSITETIRLMGTPAMERHGGNHRVAGKAASAATSRRHHQHNNPSSVSDVFESAEEAAAEVDGDEDTKLQHAARTVKPLRQASHPSGRVIKEFSLGRRLTPEETEEAMQVETTAASASTEPQVTKEDTTSASFDAASYEALSAAYHKAKVESSVLRRQLLSTDNMEMVARLESKLAGCRKEMRRLEGLLTSTIHQGHTPAADISPEGTDDHDGTFTSPATEARDVEVTGFRLPTRLPQYAEAPEFDTEPSKNHYGAAEPDLDEEEIERAIQDFDAEVHGLHTRAAPLVSTTVFHQTRPSAQASSRRVIDAADEAAEGVEAVEAVEAEASEDYSQEDAVQDDLIEETAEYKSMLRERQAHEARMAKMTEQLAAMEKRLAETAEEARLARAKRAANEKARAELEARKRAELEARREKTRLKELAVRKAEEERRRAEEEALAMEAELEKKLAEVRAKLKRAADSVAASADTAEDAAEVTQDAEVENVSAAEPVEMTAAEEDAIESELSAEPTTTTKQTNSPSAASPSTATSPTTSAKASPTVSSGFTCTPEQYDGLQLAAIRLRREIATLEAQMEEEGDEDDETLMTVLAASRADLEELDECILSVQANESWAAERDAHRLAEEKRAAADEDTEFRRVQRAIDQHRFNVELLNRRIQHATSRSVISALEQRVVQARRDIARLRVTQDRLLREGRDSFGLPKEVSMAKSLAGELKDTEAKELAEEVKRAAAGLPPSKPSARRADSEDDDVNLHSAEDAVPAGHSTDAAEESATTSSTLSTHEQQSRTQSESLTVPKVVQENPEMRQLRQRLDGILRSIQNVQEGLLRMRDAPAAYDEEEEEAALADMKDKLGQLLSLRDDILSRLKETAATATSTATQEDATETEADEHTSSRGQPLPLLRTTASHSSVAAGDFVSPKPYSAVHGMSRKRTFQSAHKKVSASARLRKSRT